MKKAALTLIAGFVAVFSFAQGSAIQGKVLDADGLPAAFVNVYVEVGGNLIGDVTAMDGSYKISGLNSGTYNLTISSVAYEDVQITGVIVDHDKTRFMDDIQMGVNMIDEGVTVIGWVEPLIDPEDPGKQEMRAIDIDNNANEKDFISLISSMSSDIVQLEGTNQVIVRGGRPTTMLYFIDGVKQPDQLSGVIGASIQSITAYTGGIPAKYGDTISGVIAVETKSYFDLYEQAKAEQMWMESVVDSLEQDDEEEEEDTDTEVITE